MRCRQSIVKICIACDVQRKHEQTSRKYLRSAAAFFLFVSMGKCLTRIPSASKSFHSLFFLFLNCMKTNHFNGVDVSHMFALPRVYLMKNEINYFVEYSNK